MSWHRFIPGQFGGGLSRWASAFQWFISHLFSNFSHKIIGNSLQQWVSKMNDFRKVIHDKLTSVPCEIELLVNDGAIDDEINLYAINILLEKINIAMLLDDTNIKSCRLGSGPFGDYTGAPRQPGNHYYQKAFYSG